MSELFDILRKAAYKGCNVTIGYDPVVTAYEVKVQKRGEEDWSKQFVTSNIADNAETALILVISQLAGIN